MDKNIFLTTGDTTDVFSSMAGRAVYTKKYPMAMTILKYIIDVIHRNIVDMGKNQPGKRHDQ